MPAVGNLDRLWSSQPSCFCIVSSTVTTDHFHTRVLREPLDKGFGPSIWQQIDHAMSLQVAQECTIALPTTPRPVIDSQHAWGDDFEHAQMPDESQEGIRTDYDGLRVQLPCSSLPTQSQAHALQPPLQALGPSSVGGNRWSQSLTKNGAGAGRIVTPEPAHTHQ